MDSFFENESTAVAALSKMLDYDTRKVFCQLSFKAMQAVFCRKRLGCGLNIARTFKSSPSLSFVLSLIDKEGEGMPENGAREVEL